MPSKLDSCNKQLQELYTYYENQYFQFGFDHKYFLIGSFECMLSAEDEALYLDRVADLKAYFHKLISSIFRGRVYPKIFMIEHRDWTYLEYKEKPGESRRYRDLIKLITPVEYDKMTRIAHIVVEYLLARGAI